MNIPPPATRGGDVLIRRIYPSRQAVFSPCSGNFCPETPPSRFRYGALSDALTQSPTYMKRFSRIYRVLLHHLRGRVSGVFGALSSTLYRTAQDG